MKIEEFKKIKKGDIVCYKIDGEIIMEQAADDAFYNLDADEPSWEILTTSGIYYCAEDLI